MRMRSEPAACSQIFLLGPSKLGALLITAALWLLPALVLAQVPSPADDEPYPRAFADRHVLQIGAFGQAANAARLMEDLQQKGFPTLAGSTTNDAGDTLTLVFTGPYADEGAALSAKAVLEENGWSGFVRTASVPVEHPANADRVAPDDMPAQVQTDDRVAQIPPDDISDRVAPDARIGGPGTNLAKDQTQLFAQVQSELFSVPPVMERPLGMDEGPRVVVNNFALFGAVNREKQSLRVSDVEAILAGHVRTQPPDGFTINQLQTIADEITRYYRERGFIIAQAIVPAQEVRDGAVSLQILEGSLEDVRVEGNRVYKAKVVERPFQSLRGVPITQGSIERALLDVQDFPGLTVFGTFTQGDELGNTDLVVRVREEKRLYVTPGIDNYGSESTGEYRGLVDFQINNMFGVADEVKGYILQTTSPSNGTYGGLSFDFPFGRNSIGFGASTNRFDVAGLAGFTALGVEGTVDQTDLYWDHTFANGRFFSASGRLGIAIKNAVTEIPGFILNEDELTVASAVFDFFVASRKGRGFSVGSFQIDVGLPDTLGAMNELGNGISSRQGGNGEFAGGDFSKVKFDYQYLRRLSTNNSMLLRLQGQWSDDLLVALEQFAIGGPQNVRAYPIAEALVDTGASAMLEWIINAPGFADKSVGSRTWGEIFQLSLYADYAYGETNSPLPSQEPTVDYSGYGLGLQFNLPGKFFARFDVAAPTGERVASNNRDPQYYFRMSYTF